MTSQNVCAAVCLVITASSLLTAGYSQSSGAPTGERMVMLDGRAVRVVVHGLETRNVGEPVVVFEAGATQSLAAWEGILPAVARMAPTVAYDRAGLGRSDWDDAAPTPRHVAPRLRRLLDELGAKPPFVMVGYSWGGMLVRHFAGDYPDEVAGLVLVDAGPMVTEPLEQNLSPFEAIGVGRRGFDAYWSAFVAAMAPAAVPIRAEFEVFRRLMQEDADRDLRPLRPVPIAIVVAAKYRPLKLDVPFDLGAHFEADLRYRTRIFQEWALASASGTLVVSNHSTHAVLREDPGLVVWAIERVLAAVRER